MGRVDPSARRVIAARMLRASAITTLLLLAACKPAASDEYQVRGDVSEERDAPSAPLDSPDVEGAAWAPSERTTRLLYGKPGEPPLFSLNCEREEIVYTRYVAADPEAKAVLALIGNGHVERLWIDAEKDGPEDDAAWLWRGRIAADDPRLEVLTGQRRVEATVPGAGSLVFNPSSLPGAYITRCAASLTPEPDPSASAE